MTGYALFSSIGSRIGSRFGGKLSDIGSPEIKDFPYHPLPPFSVYIGPLCQSIESSILP